MKKQEPIILNKMLVLGIESSCDETSIAICKDASNLQDRILSLKTYSQIKEHELFGGVVPEIAARNHLLKIQALTKAAITHAGIKTEDITHIAVTTNPGLIGGLMVGMCFAKGLAMQLQKPLININHLDGHVFTTYLTDNLIENFYCLLISGGHCQTIAVQNFNHKKIYGSTLDDSVGEAFDKLAKLLGLGYPGGAKIEALAQSGNADAFGFTLQMMRRDEFNFSFSGLKTNFLNTVASLAKQHLNIQPSELKNTANLHSLLPFDVVADLCASFQKIVATILIDRALNMIKADGKRFNKLVISGGVAANKYIKQRFINALEQDGIEVITPPISLCTDNAAMIAAACIAWHKCRGNFVN